MSLDRLRSAHLPDVAIVHEWLVTMGGSELVLRQLLQLFPDAHVFTLVDAMGSRDREFLGLGTVTTSWLQRIPAARTRHRAFLPLFPAAVRSLDLRDYDLVISNSHAVAKGVRTGPRQLHLSYCLSPMRYAWDLREQYLRESGLDRGVRGALARTVLERLRRWDRDNTPGVDAFSTLSHYVADRIRRAYGRESEVIYPPVDTAFFTPGPSSRDDRYFVTASRFVPYKRVDLIARAFRHLPGERLVIVGDGPDREKVRAAAGTNVELVGHASREALRDLLRGAQAFIFAAEEDFGIAPLEAQACGTPVIAFGRGGATETVRAGETGLFFAEQDESSLVEAIGRFQRSAPFRAEVCRENAEGFSEEAFRAAMGGWVAREWRRFSAR